MLKEGYSDPTEIDDELSDLGDKMNVLVGKGVARDTARFKTLLDRFEYLTGLAQRLVSGSGSGGAAAFFEVKRANDQNDATPAGDGAADVTAAAAAALEAATGIGFN